MSDAIKIEPNTVVFYYYIWFDFYCIRCYVFQGFCKLRGIPRKEYVLLTVGPKEK
jgi:hypothetical protein